MKRLCETGTRTTRSWEYDFVRQLQVFNRNTFDSLTHHLKLRNVQWALPTIPRQCSFSYIWNEWVCCPLEHIVDENVNLQCAIGERSRFSLHKNRILLRNMIGTLIPKVHSDLTCTGTTFKERSCPCYQYWPRHGIPWYDGKTWEWKHFCWCDFRRVVGWVWFGKIASEFLNTNGSVWFGNCESWQVPKYDCSAARVETLGSLRRNWHSILYLQLPTFSLWDLSGFLRLFLILTKNKF